MMKSLFCLTAGAVILCGCRDRALEARLATMQKQITELQEYQKEDHASIQSFAELTASNSNSALAFLNVHQTMMSNVTEVLARSAAEQEIDRARYHELTNYLGALLRSGKIVQTSVPAQPSAMPNRYGIPASVHAQIVTEAQHKWPGDYEMQEFTIKEQTEAYLRLHPR